MSFLSIPNKNLVQICVIVENIDDTAEHYRNILGFDVPHEYQGTQPRDHTRSTYMGKPSDVQAKFVGFSMGDITYELTLRSEADRLQLTQGVKGNLKRP